MRESETRNWWRICGLLVLVGVLGALATVQLGSFTVREKIYESTAILQVSLPEEVITSEEKARFLHSEASLMVSDEILQPVVFGLGLAKEWSLTPEQSLVSLRGKINITNLPEQSSRARFSISVRTVDAELTRDIASRIAIEYQRQGNEKAQLAYQRELQELDARIAAQEKLVREKRDQLETL